MRLRYFYDLGTEVCLWAADEEARDQFGHPVFLEDLPLSEETRAMGERLLAQYEGSADRNSIIGGVSWTEAQRSEFLAASEDFYDQLVKELGTRFEVLYEVRG